MFWSTDTDPTRPMGRGRLQYGKIYIGKVVEVDNEMETGKPTFLKKILGKRYKEYAKEELETFALTQVISTQVDIQYDRGGTYILNNQKELEILHKSWNSGKIQLAISLRINIFATLICYIFERNFV